jgi:hypothetical protein
VNITSNYNTQKQKITSSSKINTDNYPPRKYPEANQLIVEYPADKHKFTENPDNFCLQSPPLDRKNKVWD